MIETMDKFEKETKINVPNWHFQRKKKQKTMRLSLKQFFFLKVYFATSSQLTNCTDVLALRKQTTSVSNFKIKMIYTLTSYVWCESTNFIFPNRQK